MSETRDPGRNAFGQKGSKGMVKNKIAQRAVAAGLTGLMAFGAAAPAALAYSNKAFKDVKTSSSDDGDFWMRLGGDDRYGTMKKIVESYNKWGSTYGYNIYGLMSEEYYTQHHVAVLASGDNFPDALAANGLAGYLTNEGLTGSYNTESNAVPVVLTKAGSLSTEAKDLLKNMQVQIVYIMGGTAAVSQDVEDAITKMGIGVTRVAGADRQETSLKALQRINGNWKGRKGTYDLIIATGANYADALSISPYSYRMGTPVILTKADGTLTDAQVEAIKANDEIREIVIVGGTDAVSDTVMGQIGTLKKNGRGVSYKRIAGADRYETSAKIAEFEIDEWYNYFKKSWNGKYSVWGDRGFTFDHAIVATGENFPDALAGGQLAGGYSVFDWAEVDGFDGYNFWSPCPLLLTKDGNTQAEAIISRQMQLNDYNSATVTYDSYSDFIATIYGWYGASTAEYAALTTTDPFMNWYNTSGVFYMSDTAIDESEKQIAYATPIKVNSTTREEDWDTEIVSRVATDFDFYGIILGGTSAISNDKRDSLDDAVLYTTGENVVSTDASSVPGSVILRIGDIDTNFTYLIPAGTYTANRDGDYTFSPSGDKLFWNNNEVHVYQIGGTNSFAIFNKDSMRWFYLYGGTANTEWAKFTPVSTYLI